MAFLRKLGGLMFFSFFLCECPFFEKKLASCDFHARGFPCGVLGTADAGNLQKDLRWEHARLKQCALFWWQFVAFGSGTHALFLLACSELDLAR